MDKRNVDLVDLHSHVLPGADHGSDSVNTSNRQLMLAKKYGVTRILATPHFYPHKHFLDDFLARRAASAAELLDACDDTMPEVKLGAEVLICQGLENFKELNKLCFEGTNTIMLELPLAMMTSDLVDTACEIKEQGFEVILAHADRYRPDKIEEFISAGIDRLQLNASSLCTFFKSKHLYRWIEQGYVVALGSDIHGADEKAYKSFGLAKRKLGTLIEGIVKESDALWNKINKFN